MNIDLQTSVDIDKFLTSKKWQTEFNSLGNTDLKLSAIFAIIKCPNFTCRKTLLFKRVLLLLSVRTSQGPKEEFQKKFNKILNQLISNRIFIEYNKTQQYPRVKFNLNSNKEYLNILLKKYYKTEHNPVNKIERLKVVYNQSHPHGSAHDKNQNSLFKTEEDEYLENKNEIIEQIDTDEDFENEQEESQDDNDENLLDRFITDDIPDLENEISNSLINVSINSSDIKELVKMHFAQIPFVRVEEEYPELKLIFDNNTIGFSILIDIDTLKKVVSLKVIIELYEKAAVDILKLWGKVNRDAAICIEEYRLKDHYVIKRKVDLKRYNNEEIISLVDDMIRAAKQICITIEKHL